MSRGLPKFPKKRGRYYVMRITNPDGSRPWIRLGETIEEAKFAYADYIKQLKSKNSPYPTYRVTLKQAIEAYYEIKEGRVKPNSLQRFKEIINNFKQFIVEKYPSLNYLDELETRHFSEFMNYRLKNGISPVTINFERDTLSNLFNLLIKEKNLHIENPVKNTSLLSVPSQDGFFYSDEEVLKILEVSKQFCKKINWHAIFATLFYTGMRRNELRYLTWQDLDLERGCIYIKPKHINEKLFFEPKDKEMRTIPIHPELLPILKELPKKNERWVFVNSVTKILGQDKIRQEFQKICKAAELPVKKLHKTRHSWASLMTERGVPLDVIQELGGWADAETMNKYKHLAEDYKARIFKERFTLGAKKQDDLSSI